MTKELELLPQDCSQLEADFSCFQSHSKGIALGTGTYKEIEMSEVGVTL